MNNGSHAERDVDQQKTGALDGVYRLTDGAPVFQAVPAPTPEQLETLLTRIIKRVLRVLTRKGALIEEEAAGIPYLADTDRDPALAPLQAAACTYRIALGPRAGQKVLTWKDPALGLSRQEPSDPPQGCVRAQGFNLQADVHCGPLNRMLKKTTSGVLGREASSRTGVRSGGFAPSGLAGGLFDHPVVLGIPLVFDIPALEKLENSFSKPVKRHTLERLCRYITCPALGHKRLTRTPKGDVVLQLKTPYRDGTTHIVMAPLEFLQRLAALVPRPRLHLIRFHGVLAPKRRPPGPDCPRRARSRDRPRAGSHR